MVGLGTLTELAEEFPRDLDEGLDALALDMARRIIDTSRPPRRSGTLERSQAVDAQGMIYSTAPYAGVIRFGWPRRNIRAQDWLAPAASRVETEYANEAADLADELLRRRA